MQNLKALLLRKRSFRNLCFRPGGRELCLFVLTASLIIIFSYDFLKPAFKIGLTPEDREFILRYKLLGSNPLSKILEVWSERGAYTTVPIYYIGTIQSLTGFNYPLIQFIGASLRALAALSIFPLAALIFKNLPLAVLSTLIFAFSYTTTGALETGVEPSEYLGFLLMNIFLMSYYLLNTKYFLKFKWLLLTSVLLFISVMSSVMRVYPILFLVPLIEGFLILLDRKKYKIKFLFLKLLILYLPFFILSFISPVSASGHFSLPAIIAAVFRGNWHLMLTPLEGLGFIIPLGKYYSNLGLLDLTSMSSYLTFLLGGPLVLFGFLSLIISIIVKKNKLFFFLRIFLLNFGFEILIYWIVKHSWLMLPELRLNYDILRLYPVLFGIFIFSLMINFLIEWLKGGKKNNLFITLWVGPFLALFFIIMTYFFSAIALSFGGAQDHYLLIPTMGISLLMGAIILFLFAKLQSPRLKIVGFLTVVTLILFLYVLNREKTYNYFEKANFNGRAAAGQEYLQAEIREIFKDLDYLKPVLVYFDTSDIPEGKDPFYFEGLLTPFPVLMYYQQSNIISSCIGVINEDRQMFKLKKTIKKLNNEKVFVYETSCLGEGKINVKEVVYKKENFTALKIRNDGFIDIKEEVLKELNF